MLYSLPIVSRYRLKSGIAGVEHSSTGMHLTHILSGAILEIPDTERESGMIEIVYGGRNVSVFLPDVRERAERVDGREHRSKGHAAPRAGSEGC